MAHILRWFTLDLAVKNVILSTDDRKGELYWKKNVAFTRHSEGAVAQRTTRLTTNQEVADSPRIRHGDRLFTPMFLVNQNKTSMSTDTRKTLRQPKEERINQRG